MRTLDRYLLSEMFLPFITGILAIVVMLVGNTLFQLIDNILKYHIPLILVAKVVAYNIPGLLVLTLPVGMALSAAFAVNRMARDSEITAIRMAGVPLRRLFLPIFLVGLFSSAVAFVIGDQVVPQSQRAFARTQGQMYGYVVRSPDLVSNRVIKFENYDFYVRSTHPLDPAHSDQLVAEGVTIFQDALPGKFPVIVTAQQATYDHGIWHVKNALIHQLDRQGFTSTEVYAKSGTLDLSIPLPTVDPEQSTGFVGTSDNLSLAELGRNIAILGSTGMDTTKLKVDYQFKMALPLLCLAFAICAPPLALRFSRAGAFMGIFLSIMMVFVAWNTLLLSKAFGITGHIPPLLAAWCPDILFACLGLFLIARSE